MEDKILLFEEALCDLNFYVKNNNQFNIADLFYIIEEILVAF